MESEICVLNLQNACPDAGDCCQVHYHLPYLWQVGYESKWFNIIDSLQEDIEKKFSDVDTDLMNGEFQIHTGSKEDGGLFKFFATLDLVNFSGKTAIESSEKVFQLKRLSTLSYGQVILKQAKSNNISEENEKKFYTHWRWYYLVNGTWKSFGEDEISPEQSVMETKFSFGQEVYRFEVNKENASSNTFLIDFRKLCFLNLEVNESTKLKRRPLFIAHEDVKKDKWIPFSSWKLPIYLKQLPFEWCPIDYKSDYELIPINPSSMHYHVVLSEFQQTVPNKTVIDIFSVQNAFLWNNYSNKKIYMEENSNDVNEMMLFHGTVSLNVIKCILKQNFDWRLYGKNATQYGKGSYFARDAYYSDRYSTTNNKADHHWMFMARVLVGKYVKGNCEYNRPPPINFSKPYGELFDSCVDNPTNPKIFVIFNTDQCYPQYLFSYR